MTDTIEALRYPLAVGAVLALSAPWLLWQYIRASFGAPCHWCGSQRHHDPLARDICPRYERMIDDLRPGREETA